MTPPGYAARSRNVAASFAIASIVNFGAFGFAPASVLAPLESIQFVTNLLFARFVSKKAVSPRMVVGVAMIVSGTVLSIIFGPNQVANFSIDELKRFWRMTAWLVYLCLIGVVALTCLAIHSAYERAALRGSPRPRDGLVRPVTFALSSALAGSMCVVQAKSMSELVELVLTDGLGHVLGDWLFWYNVPPAGFEPTEPPPRLPPARTQ